MCSLAALRMFDHLQAISTEVVDKTSFGMPILYYHRVRLNLHSIKASFDLFPYVVFASDLCVV